MALHRQEKRVTSLVEISKKTNTPSVQKYLSSKWIKGNVSRRILVLDTSLFIHFDDKYFRTKGVTITKQIYWPAFGSEKTLFYLVIQLRR